jgi:hypothetical protein
LEKSIPTWKMRLMSFIDLDVLAIAAHGGAKPAKAARQTRDRR